MPIQTGTVMTERATFFDTPLLYLKGLGPQRTELLNKELNLFTYGDLIQYYPFRYDDRTRYYTISELMDSMPSAQIRGRIRDWYLEGEGPKKRLVATFSDGTGSMSLVWFQSITYLEKALRREGEYIVYGKPQSFNGQFSIVHPELENANTASENEPGFFPVYNLTEKLRKRHLDSKVLGKAMRMSARAILAAHSRNTARLAYPAISADRQAGGNVEYSPASKSGLAETGPASAEVRRVILQSTAADQE